MSVRPRRTTRRVRAPTHGVDLFAPSENGYIDLYTSFVHRVRLPCSKVLGPGRSRDLFSLHHQSHRVNRVGAPHPAHTRLLRGVPTAAGRVGVSTLQPSLPDLEQRPCLCWATYAAGLRLGTRMFLGALVWLGLLGFGAPLYIQTFPINNFPTSWPWM